MTRAEYEKLVYVAGITAVSGLVDMLFRDITQGVTSEKELEKIFETGLADLRRAEQIALAKGPID